MMQLFHSASLIVVLHFTCLLAAVPHGRRHPDKCKGDECESTFVAIAKAYEVLSDNETRADYDYALEHPDAVFYK